MTDWLLDTNVLSEIRKRRPPRKVVAFVAEQPLDLLYIRTVTLAEIRFGIELVIDANRRAELTAWLTHKVRPLFAQRVLEVSEDVLFKWRLLVEEDRKSGHTFAARFVHRGDGVAPWNDGRLTGHARVRTGGGSGIQSVGMSGPQWSGSASATFTWMLGENLPGTFSATRPGEPAHHEPGDLAPEL